MEGVTIIKSFLGTKQGDPLKSLLFVLAHYRALLKTITHAPSCIFPPLVNNTHIVGPLNEITHTFDHLSTQLTLIGLRVKVLKCKFWSPSGVSLGINIPKGCTLVTKGLHILGVP